MKKLLKKLLTLGCALTIALTATACGGDNGGGGGNHRDDEDVVEIYITANTYTEDTLYELEDYYNDNIAEGYRIFLNVGTNFYSSVGEKLESGSIAASEVSDKEVKGYIMSGAVEPLDSYIASGKLNVSDMSSNIVDRFRLDPATGDVGPDAPLYAIPRDISPSVMYYNATALKAVGINIVSYPEDSLPAGYLPHGYYEYSVAPEAGLTISDGVYKVFNDCIPMSWEELHQIAKYLTLSASRNGNKYNPESPTNYAYYNEWWFNYGWSVGGDCLENSEDGLVFTLAEDDANYLVTKDTTVNGTAYKAGELLGYLDKLWVAENGASDALYELPSQYDAFLEFCRLSQFSTVSVTTDGNNPGYAISPRPTDVGSSSKFQLLTTKQVAFSVESLTASRDLAVAAKNSGIEWGIAPQPSYREYNEDGTLKTVNGTVIKGVQAAHNLGCGFVVSKNTPYKEETIAFLSWLTSEYAQRELTLAAGTAVSALNSLSSNADYQASLKAVLGCRNILPLINIAQNAMQGDWSYVEDGDWITDWANALNGPVRNGEKTLDAFWAEWQPVVTADLQANYITKKFR